MYNLNTHVSRLRTRRRDVAAAQREVVEELHRALLEEDQSFKADFNQRETVFSQMKVSERSHRAGGPDMTGETARCLW